ESVLEGVGRAPFAGDHRVVAEMPPSIVAELLRPAVDLPASERLETLVIQHEDAARRLAVLGAERGHVDTARAAMHGMRPRVAGLFRKLLRFDHLDDLGGAGIGLGVKNVDAGGAQTRNDQVAPLDMRVRRVGTQAGRTGIPAKMVKLVARMGGGNG